MNQTVNMPELDIDPYAAENLIDPYPMHQRIREAGPVVRLTPYASLVACAANSSGDATIASRHLHGNRGRNCPLPLRGRRGSSLAAALKSETDRGAN